MKNTNLPAVKLYGLQFFYNISQVALCSYMCIEAVVQAYRNVRRITFFLVVAGLTYMHTRATGLLGGWLH